MSISTQLMQMYAWMAQASYRDLAERDKGPGSHCFELSPQLSKQMLRKPCPNMDKWGLTFPFNRTPDARNLFARAYAGGGDFSHCFEEIALGIDNSFFA